MCPGCSSFRKWYIVSMNLYHILVLTLALTVVGCRGVDVQSTKFNRELAIRKLECCVFSKDKHCNTLGWNLSDLYKLTNTFGIKIKNPESKDLWKGKNSFSWECVDGTMLCGKITQFYFVSAVTGIGDASDLPLYIVSLSCLTAYNAKSFRTVAEQLVTSDGMPHEGRITENGCSYSVRSIKDGLVEFQITRNSELK